MTRALLRTGTLLAVAAGLACGVRADGPPRIEEDRTACAHCGMLVSERVFAAAYRAPGQPARVFDDIGCLRSAAAGERDPAALTFWFHDAVTREWIAGERASFVHAASLKTPMAGGMLAYDGVEAAGRGAAEHRGRVIRSIAELLGLREEGS